MQIQAESLLEYIQKLLEDIKRVMQKLKKVINDNHQYVISAYRNFDEEVSKFPTMNN